MSVVIVVIGVHVAATRPEQIFVFFLLLLFLFALQMPIVQLIVYTCYVHI